ncbi:MAG TPA: hypothetical protein VN231_12815 [Allosphingosinicella sp.]|nr:hypothetical protein [Allosphingosinicella sp.]
MHSKASTAAIAAFLIAAAGCGEQAEAPANVAAAPGDADVQNRLAAMPEGQRNGVFIRAIRDARQECQHVESSVPAGEHQGFPVWNATCSGGGTWTIVVMNDGTATVLNAEEARLVGNEAEPGEGQGR